MIEVSEAFRNAALNGTVSSEMDIIVFGYNEDGSNLHIGNSNIVSESMVIEQSVCDDSDLKFGGCIASSFEIEVFGIPDLTGRYITVVVNQTAEVPLYPSDTLYPQAEAYPGFSAYKEGFAVFSGEIFSCKLSDNRLTRKIVAYDRFYWRGNINCSQWYRSLHNTVSGTSVTQIGTLRKAVCRKYGIIEQYPDDELPLDDMRIEQYNEKLTVSDVLRSVCEMSGVFCILNGNGNIEYHTLSNDDAIPDTIRKPGTESYGFDYSDCSCEEFTKSFTGILHRDKSGNSPWFGITGENSFYILEDNIIADSYTGAFSWHNEISSFIDDWHVFMKYLRFKAYTPMTLKAPCRLWLQVGDRINFNIRVYDVAADGSVTSRTETVTSYILSRRITGIQALTDELSANAENIKYTEADFEENT